MQIDGKVYVERREMQKKKYLPRATPRRKHEMEPGVSKNCSYLFSILGLLTTGCFRSMVADRCQKIYKSNTPQTGKTQPHQWKQEGKCFSSVWLFFPFAKCFFIYKSSDTNRPPYKSLFNKEAEKVIHERIRATAIFWQRTQTNLTP